IEIVERALDRYGPPVYVRKQIVHNVHVVRDLERRGAVFVDALEEVPPQALVVFSAHGVSPQVRQEARQRSLKVIDATCPLVTKVHSEAKRFARAGYTIVLVGHEGHEEVEGTTGEAPDAIRLIERADQIDDLDVPNGGSRVAYLTEATLAVDTVTVTAGASAPEVLVDRVVGALRGLGPVTVEERQVMHESVQFTLPIELRPGVQPKAGR